MARSGRAEKTRVALMNSPRIWAYVNHETDQTEGIPTDHEKALLRHTSCNVEVSFKRILIVGWSVRYTKAVPESLPRLRGDFARVPLLDQADMMSVLEWVSHG
jgi:hypothetical protein